MNIKQKRVRSYEKYFGFLKPNESFRTTIDISKTTPNIIKKLGFPSSIKPGMKILPASRTGNVSLFNSEGKVVKRKDLPMETAYRTIEWHWKEWRGQGRTEEMSDFRDVPYKRYIRDFTPPPSEEIEIIQKNNKLFLSSRVLINKQEDQKINLHTLNLFLEIFGQATFVSKNLKSFYSPKHKNLNWQILPPGKYPWERIKKRLDNLVKTLPQGNQSWAHHRISTIESYKPEFHATGTGGFYGYAIYGFPSYDFYVLECVRHGNATYIFKKKWEKLSQLTKAQVLNSEEDIQRIIHVKSWTNKIDEVIANKIKVKL